MILSKDDGWELLDEPNRIYAREIGFSSFEFAKADQEFVRVIDLSDYSKRQIKDIVAEYNSLTYSDLFIIYKEDTLITIAEYLFRQELKEDGRL